MTSCNQNDDNDNTHQRACTGGAQSTAVSWQHAPPLTPVSSLAGIKRMPRKLQVLLASLCHALIPFLWPQSAKESSSQREAIIQTNYLLPLQEVTTYLNPLISYFPIYLSYHQVQDFKAITHLLNSYSYSYLRDIFPALLHPSTPPLWNYVSSSKSHILAFSMEDPFPFLYMKSGSPLRIQLPLQLSQACLSLSHWSWRLG